MFNALQQKGLVEIVGFEQKIRGSGFRNTVKEPTVWTTST